jgi:hypothetical protein
MEKVKKIRARRLSNADGPGSSSQFLWKIHSRSKDQR